MMKVVDMHCDTILKLYDDLHHGKEGSFIRNDGHIDLKKMQKGDYLLQNFAMFVDLSENPQPFLKANQLINYYYHEIEKYPELIKPVFLLSRYYRSSTSRYHVFSSNIRRRCCCRK